MNTKVLVGSMIILLIYSSIAVAQWPQATFSGNRYWEVEVGARILDRPGNDQNFTLITNSVTLQPVFTVNDATDLDASIGPDVRILRKTDYRTEWELRGFYNSWDIFERNTGPLTTPLLFGTALSQIDYGYNSNLFNLELNWRRSLAPGVTFLFGPRFFYMDELVSIDATVPDGVAPGIDLLINTRSKTKNPGIGINFGGEFRKPIARDIFAMGFIKGALLANAGRAQVETSTVALTAVLTRTTLMDERSTHMAGVIEVGGRLHYDVVPGNISVYAGYEGTWFDGAILAPAQFLEVVGNPAAPMLNHSQTPYFGGLVFGLTARR